MAIDTLRIEIDTSAEPVLDDWVVEIFRNMEIRHRIADMLRDDLHGRTRQA